MLKGCRFKNMLGGLKQAIKDMNVPKGTGVTNIRVQPGFEWLDSEMDCGHYLEEIILRSLVP